MKKKYAKIVLFILFLSVSVQAQNRLKENAAYQQTIKFESPTSKEMAVANFLAKNGLDANNTFVAKPATTDESGLVHQRNQQYYKGILVEFGTYITHTKNGNVKSINGELYNPSTVNTNPTISERTGLQYAKNHINATKYLWEDKQQADIVGYSDPVGVLVILPNVKTGGINLAYKYDIYATEPISRDEIYIDAHTGDFLYANPIIKHAHDFDAQEPISEKEIVSSLVTTTANTKYSGARNMETSFNATLNMWVLNDLTRGNGVVTYNCQNIPGSYQNVHFQDNDNVWSAAEHANTQLDNAAQDCQWGAEMTYDFWKNVFNRNSYDNNNSQIKSYMHFRPTAAAYSNASWNGSFMVYGDGTSLKPFSSIDVCGHEIGHAVCTHTANLVYQNQSGAMNEGFSDIWGACIEHFGRTGALTGTPVLNVWKIGEDIQSGALRFMNTPNSKSDPDTFQGTYWFTTADEGSCTPTTANDRCGVHTNSGVMNRWFYVLTAGASGTNNAIVVADRDTYNVTGIGMVKSSQIAYYAERDYLTPNSTYFDMREATIQVANSLYCASSPEVIAVTNAWNSVNVGASFISFANDVSLKNLAVVAPVNCTSTSFVQPIIFDNLGTNAISTVSISYNIDGGTNTNTSWTGSLATCASGTLNLNISTSGLSRGTHTLTVVTTITGDGNSSNNTKAGAILVNNPTSTGVTNTFENASDVLVSYDENGRNDLWMRGTSAKATLTDAIAGNSKVYTTNLNDIYGPNAKSYLVTQCYDLTTVANPVIKFDLAFDTEYSADVLYMQYSTNGGTTWTLLGTDADPNWYTSNLGCPNCVGGEWSGEGSITNASGFTNDTKRQYSKSLSAISSSNNALFRFVFRSNGINEYDGAIIDNLIVEGSLATNNTLFNELKIYPNPATSNLNIAFDSQSSENGTITILDIQGRMISKINFDGNIGNINKTIDISSFPQGFYMLKLMQGDLEYNTKIIKE